MKQNIKRLLIIASICIFSIIGTEDVFAERIYYNQCSYPLKGDTVDKYAVKNSVTSDLTDNDHFTAYASNGHIVYCIERGVRLLNNPDTYDGPEYVSYNTNINNNILDKVLVYGYSGEDNSTNPTCSTDRAATQLVVWFASKEVADKTTAWRTLSQSELINMTNADIGAKAYNLIQLVLNHDKVPSFAKSSSDSASNAEDKIILKYNATKYNYTGTISDRNNILSTWSLGTIPNKITASINKNELTITSTDDSVTTPISLSKTIKDNTTGYKRTHETYQDTAYIIPKTKKISSYVGYQYEKIGKGVVKVHKIDKYTGKNMQNATFGIFSDSDCKTKAKDYLGNELSEKTTDKNGFAEWNDLYYPLNNDEEKIYYIKETKVIEGYSIDNSQMELLGAGENACVPVVMKEKNETSKEIGEKNVEVQAIYNIPYGNITILKQDVDTGASIEGVEFKLLKLNKDKTQAIDINGKTVENVITNKYGIAEFKDIPYGDYILEEVKTTNSYKVLKEPIEFTLDKDTDALKYKGQGTDTSLLPVVSSKDKFKYTLGDPNNDGNIDNKDLEILNKAVSGDASVTVKEKYAIDVNQDGKVNNEDIDLMTKYINGDKNTFTSKEINVTTEDLVPLEVYKLGDSNDDNIIDNKDIEIIDKIINNNDVSNEITNLEKYASDVNQDGKVDNVDKELILTYIEGDKTVFEGLKEIPYPNQFQKRVTLVVTNVPIDIKISKQAITNSKELKGAKIVIKTEDGKVLYEYISDGKAKEFYIPIGEYVLTETVAPKGYDKLKTDVKFKVDSEGNIKLLSAKSNMYKLINSKDSNDTDLDHLIIYNNLSKIPVPDTGSKIAFITIVLGTLLIGGGGYAIYNRYKFNH